MRLYCAVSGHTSAHFLFTVIPLCRVAVVAGEQPAPQSKRLLLRKVRHAMGSLSMDSKTDVKSEKKALSVSAVGLPSTPFQFAPAPDSAGAAPRLMFKLLETVSAADSKDKALPSRLMVS